jgi:hypothetical protein
VKLSAEVVCVAMILNVSAAVNEGKSLGTVKIFEPVLGAKVARKFTQWDLG